MSTTDRTDYPLLTRFYGIAPRELAEMPRGLLRIYREAVPALLAQEMLAAIQVSSFPHIEDNNVQSEIHSTLMHAAGIEEPGAERAFVPGTPQDVLALSGLGIGVTIEKNDQ